MNEDQEIIVKNTPKGGKRGRAPQDNSLIEMDPANKGLISNTLQFILDNKADTIVEDDEDAKVRIDRYFRNCIEADKRPTVEGLALCLGTTRQSLWEWETGKGNGKVPKISAYIIKNAKESIASIDADLVSCGKLNPVAYIFRSKNYYGMRDQQEIVVSPNTDNVDVASLIEEAEIIPD